MKRRSLSNWLVGYLFLAQIGAFLLMPLTDIFITAFGLVPPGTMVLNDWSEFRARGLVADAIAPGPDGRPAIVMTEALRDYIGGNPKFRFAAFDMSVAAPLPGSSHELASALTEPATIEAISLKFHLRDDPNPVSRGHLRKTRSSLGDFMIATYGSVFSWRDLPPVLLAFFSINAIIDLIPAFLAAGLIAWMMVRRGLGPLRAAAESVSHVDMDSLDQRIAAEDAPAEIAPFVDAVNEALERLSAGVAAQRRFTANAAHELRTPIAIMRAHVDSSDEASLRRDIRYDIRRLQTIVEQLLITARISGREHGAFERVDLGALALRLVADYTPLIIDNRRHIDFEPPPASVFVQGNHWAIECVIANLIDNALKAEPVGGVVRVEVGSDASVAVIDHGAGVAPADRTRIFEPFWRKSEAARGAGLGLAISKELVELQEGSITIEDTPNGGATFRIRLKPEAAAPRG